MGLKDTRRRLPRVICEPLDDEERRLRGPVSVDEPRVSRLVEATGPGYPVDVDDFVAAQGGLRALGDARDPKARRSSGEPPARSPDVCRFAYTIAVSKAHVVNLSGVPETSLWTLYNRACEATRRNAILRDPECVRVFNSIDYDFVRSFGPPDGSHALRSRIFDDAVRPWILANPGGTVIELGAGLETQFQRLDDGRVRWYCVDVPEAIEVRERFIRPNGRCVHIRRSALDLAWLSSIKERGPAFITAQGLFMYFDEEPLRRLFTALCETFPDSQLMFDTVPLWFSRATQRGWGKTEHYRFPPMNWGINRRMIEPTLRRWSRQISRLRLLPWAPVRGVRRRITSGISRAPLIREWVPAIVQVVTAGRDG